MDSSIRRSTVQAVQRRPHPRPCPQHRLAPNISGTSVNGRPVMSDQRVGGNSKKNPSDPPPLSPTIRRETDRERRGKDLAQSTKFRIRFNLSSLSGRWTPVLPQAKMIDQALFRAKKHRPEGRRFPDNATIKGGPFLPSPWPALRSAPRCTAELPWRRCFRRRWR